MQGKDVVVMKKEKMNFFFLGSSFDFSGFRIFAYFGALMFHSFPELCLTV